MRLADKKRPIGARTPHASLALFLMLGGCASTELDEDKYLHSLTVQWDGEPFSGLEVPDGATWMSSPNGHQDFDVQISDIEARITRDEPKRVVVFIHGGLNTLATGLKRTKRAVTYLRDTWNVDPDNAGKTVYPVFINWHSRFVTWYDRLFRIREGRSKQGWAWLTWPIVLVADVGRALARLPVTTFLETRCAASNSFGLRAVADAPRRWPSSQVNLFGPPYDLGAWSDTVSFVTQLVPGVLRPATMFLTDSVLYDSYRMMLRRIDMLFRTEADYTAARVDGTACGTNGAISKLMDMLAELQQSSAPQSPEIVLIGHSLGTIAINEILRRNPELKVKDVVYMAAACSAKDFIDTVPPYLDAHDGTNFYSLCLHPFADADEDPTYSLLPRGSLLEWLDSYALKVKTPLDLTFGKWNNAMRVLPLLNDLKPDTRSRIHIKGFPVVGDAYPSTHGDFDEFVFWEREFWNPSHTAEPTHLPKLE